MITEPKNEIELIIWFIEGDWCKDFGFTIESATSTSFPDAILSDLSGKLYKTEFEFYASSFIEHEHNPYDCDLIICWKNDFPIQVEFPIWELCSNTLPMNWNAKDDDRELIYQHIQNVMNNRITRRKDRNSQDWRKIRPTLNPEQVRYLAISEPRVIVQEFAKSGISVSPRTASNWKSNAMKELEIEQEN